jgi:hypothetical protein
MDATNGTTGTYRVASIGVRRKGGSGGAEVAALVFDTGDVTGAGKVVSGATFVPLDANSDAEIVINTTGGITPVTKVWIDGYVV